MTSKERIYAFLDAQNLNLGVREQGWVLDLKKFRIYLENKYKVDKAFFFIGYIKHNSSFYKFLHRVGYTVVFKPTIIQSKGKRKIIKGNVDAELVLHSMIEYGNYDKAIIVTGDGDFHCLIDYLQEKNKLLKLFIPNKKSFSALLRKFYPSMVFLNALKRKVVKRKRKAIPRYG
ncbi:NYN domain-containing protein [Patescibacteria group bacterium]